MDIFPHHSVLLLDTYDVRAALEKIIAIGRKPRGVRLDSGDLTADSVWVRQKLDEAGWGDVEIFISGDLDEERIFSLLDAGARVDTFGVGTSLSTSSDAPTLSVLYKLVEVERGGEVREAAKFSAAKVTYPGRKQVYRDIDSQGDYAGDVIALEEERMPGERLLVPVLRAGERVSDAPSLAEMQKRCQSQIERLPAPLRGLAPCGLAYPVRHSARLEALLEQVRERITRTVSRA
jgi:nicotinate phosphoribosyltransferase